jgi:hypothetical protein
MPTLINQGKIEMSVQDHVGSSMNESGTSEKIDTPLTQAGSPNVLRGEGGPLENNDAWRWLVMTYGTQEPRTAAGSSD